MLEEEGYLGMPTLRAECPDLPPCELRDLRLAYGRYFRATHRRSVARLTWHGAGYVWAMDHVHPKKPLNDGSRAVFAVRDLGSGAQLAWHAVPDETSDSAAIVLQSLLDCYGPPLLFKSDNGSAFKGQEVRGLRETYDIAWLPSPPYMPWYNGSCEAANYSQEKRTAHFARHADRWTVAALEAARRQANRLARPQGHRNPTPAERWDARTPVPPAQRQQFRAAIERHQQQIIAARKVDYDPNNKNHQNQVLRQAVRQTLLEFGLLTITWRSIPLPLKRKKRAKIS